MPPATTEISAGSILSRKRARAMLSYALGGFVLFAGALSAACSSSDADATGDAGASGSDGSVDSSDAGLSPSPFEKASMKRGGRLYDKWWKTTGAKTTTEPSAANPDYAKTTGKVTGVDTWRCKECHGWDYRGKDGAYATGSHASGVAGLLDAKADDPQVLFDSIKNGVPNTAMTAYKDFLSDEDVWDLVKFIKVGVADHSAKVSAAKTPIGADLANGSSKYAMVCANSSCHGTDGNLINFGSMAEPEYVGTIAKDNPFEFFHKVRVGQPGELMPSALEDSLWTEQDVLDVLGHAQTLPTL